ncbi:vanadium-dependent haloperoxidase [Iningainema tapete]|uniref:Phosphatase PAP2 family protein n=1 Tax=Iningainema tapete BLCC-T55 TaxID=2748662 RepID=A0A8J7C9D3_9CYAN|nr:vanadium-dependent haloperoxidase [Iningainema tapete]MBD2770895.1 phosphatase PAP2 family protein [Iningainema tapete BLCC-T55]
MSDAVLQWNSIALQVVANDHTPDIVNRPDQGGPTRTSRALAIVHAAIFDAVNSIDGSFTPYLTSIPGVSTASIEAAVAKAAFKTLVHLYPSQKDFLKKALTEALEIIPDGESKEQGLQVGKEIATQILAARSNDNSDLDQSYVPGLLPGLHREDPLNPGQGFLTPRWGAVTPFTLNRNGGQGTPAFRAPAPPALISDEYTIAFNEVKDKGGDGKKTCTSRTQEETEIGIFWAYDGTPRLGPPPRLYNQIAQQIAKDQNNKLVENARLFALVNLAMADAGIQCWDTKFFYNIWRPILGIREADPGTGPSGQGDGNPATIGDPCWTPLGAPNTNRPGGRNFTPNFPAYTSGHATFGAALFQTLKRFYCTDTIAFTIVSDEFNGQNVDVDGTVRPLKPRSFNSFSEASEENGQSRIYLGIHWQFDKVEGIRAGEAIADFVFDNFLQPTKH